MANDDNNHEEGSAPPEFTCPITQDVMKVPVVAQDGHSYEEFAIQEWFDKGKRTSPVTREHMADITLRPNHQLKSQIEAWKDQSVSSRLEALLTQISWAPSSVDVTQAIARLQRFMDSRDLFVSSTRLIRLRGALAADKSVWCECVERVLGCLGAHCEAAQSSLLSYLSTAKVKHPEKTEQLIEEKAKALREKLSLALTEVSELEWKIRIKEQHLAAMSWVKDTYTEKAGELQKKLQKSGGEAQDDGEGRKRKREADDGEAKQQGLDGASLFKESLAHWRFIDCEQYLRRTMQTACSQRERERRERRIFQKEAQARVLMELATVRYRRAITRC